MTHAEKVKTYGQPLPGQIYTCQVQNFNSKNITTIDLKWIGEDDVSWRTADDGSEIDEWNWDVISWVKKN